MTIADSEIAESIFVLSGIVIVDGLLIHYAWPAKPKESGTNAIKPLCTLGGVIQTFIIVVGLFVAFALWDAFVVWGITSH